MSDQAERSIEAARRSFNRELLSPDYPRIHGDEDQVGRLVGFVDPRPGARYLDLATGRGIMAFAIAGAAPRARVTGIDIAERAIWRNRAEAKEQNCANIEFSPAMAVSSISPTPASTPSPAATPGIISPTPRPAWPKSAGC